MGSAASCFMLTEGERPTGTVIHEDTNPFITSFSKKERQMLRDTWTQISDPKQVIQDIFVTIIDTTPELKPIFGVKRVPKVAMLQMPKMGAHVGHFLSFLDQVTSLLGLMDNCLGAWQIVRKLGRAHASKVEFLRRGNEEDNHYFFMFSETLKRKLLPYLTGEAQTSSSDNGKKELRFNIHYAEADVRVVWDRFWTVVTNELRESLLFESKKLRRQSAASIMVPQQEREQEDRKHRKINKKQVDKHGNNGDLKPQQQKDKLLQAMSTSSGVDSCSESDEEEAEENKK